MYVFNVHKLISLPACIEGLCWDTEDDVSSDWDYCNEWGTSTTDSDYEDAQDTYEAAHGLIVTGMVFVIVAALLLVFFQFLPMEPFKKFFRFGAIFFYGLSGVFFAIALATASDTYLTDVATYGQNDYCSSTATFPNVAWAFGFLSVFVSVMLSWSLYQPCGGCRDNNPQQGIDESLVGNENDK